MENDLKNMLSGIPCHKLLAVYLRPEQPDVFVVGSVLAWQAESFICLKTVSPEGNYDGYMIYNPAYIYRCEVDSRYLRKLSDKTPQTADAFPSIGSWSDFIHFAIQQHVPVQVIGCNSKQLARGTLCGYSEQAAITLQRTLKSGVSGNQRRFFLSNIAGIAFNLAGDER